MQLHIITYTCILCKKYIKYYSIKDNKVGGFYIKEYIERDDIKHIVLNNRKIGMIKLVPIKSIA